MSLLILIGLLVGGALVVSGQDEEAPMVAGPTDIPGADIVLKEGATYEHNATGSTDNVGIVLYEWKIANPDGTWTNVSSTSPTYLWTASTPGIYKVISWAVDGVGNRGWKVYTIDVYEEVTAQDIINTDVTYDHSIAVTSGSLDYSDARIDITGGLAADKLVEPKGEQLSEWVVNTGKYAGKWDCANPEYEYDPGYYGYAYEDTSVKLVGRASIRNSGGRYHYGLTYTFDKAIDLTEYDQFTFWVHSGHTTPYMYYLYFYNSGRHC